MPSRDPTLDIQPNFEGEEWSIPRDALISQGNLEEECQEHGIFKLFITHSFFKLSYLLLLFESFTPLSFIPPSFKQQNVQSIPRQYRSWTNNWL
jgi:hypothetical protein